MSNIDINQIFKNQETYFQSGSTRSYKARKEALTSLLFLILENEELIHKALRLDIGKGEFESTVGETIFVVNEVKYAIKKLKSWMKNKRVCSPLIQFPARSFIHPEPLGTILIIAPWNYPFQLIFSPLVGALAAGNTAILKPSEISPNVSKLISKLVPLYFRPEHVTVVEGEVPETTALLKLPFDHIFFTGNEVVGRIILKAAALNLTSVTLELGGKSPCALFEVHNMELAIKRIVWGKFFNSGQTCVAPDYLLIKKGRTSEVVDLFKKIITEFYDAPKSSPDYGKIINKSHFDRLSQMIDKDKVLLEYGEDRDNLYMGPVILNANSDSLVMKSEIFGPLLPIVEVENIDAAINLVKSGGKPLASYIFSDNDNLIDQWVDQVSSGGMCINDTIVHMSTESLPFGGVGASGMGQYHGRTSFNVFSHQKSIMKRFLFWDLPLRYPPYSKKYNLVRKIFMLFG